MSSQRVFDAAAHEPLRQSFHDYIVHELGQSPRTARTYAQGLKRLERFCGRPVEELVVDDGRRFLREAELASSTKNNTLAAWKAYHRFGVLEGRWELNGILALRVRKEHRKRGPSLTSADVPRILDACALPADFRMIYLGLYAGLRRREATFVRREHWQDGWLLVAEGKGGKERRVPVHPELEVVRRMILATDPIGDATLQNASQRVRRRSGVVFQTHWLRRTFSRKLEAQEVAHEVIGELLGHASDMTSHYAGVSERRMVEAVNQLSLRQLGLRPHSELQRWHLRLR